MKNLLVAIDFSDQTPQVLSMARSLAGGFSCHVWLIHVAAPEPDFVGYDVGPQCVRDSVAEHLHKEHQQLQALAKQLRADGLEATALLVQGPTVSTLLEEIAKRKADHLLLGSHGRTGLSDLFMGSVSKELLKSSPVPLTLIGPQCS